MPFKSPLNEDLYDLWMCQNEDCGAVRAIGISEANASDSLRQQELEDADLECKVCGEKGMEKTVPTDEQSNGKTSTATETTKPLLATGSTSIEIRQSYVVNHLQAIDVFEFKVRSIELTQEGNNWNEIPSETKQRYVTYSTSSITRCIAFLEATVNEMVRRITASESDLAGAGYEIHPSLRAQASGERVRSLVTNREPFFEKYEVISQPKNKPIGAPIKLKIMVSITIMENTFHLFIPIAISIPNSRVRSRMTISIVFKIPNASARTTIIVIMPILT